MSDNDLYQVGMLTALFFIMIFPLILAWFDQF